MNPFSEHIKSTLIWLCYRSYDGECALVSKLASGVALTNSTGVKINLLDLYLIIMHRPARHAGDFYHNAQAAPKVAKPSPAAKMNKQGKVHTGPYSLTITVLVLFPLDTERASSGAITAAQPLYHGPFVFRCLDARSGLQTNWSNAASKMLAMENKATYWPKL
jgi:hypothetical protein